MIGCATDTILVSHNNRVVTTDSSHGLYYRYLPDGAGSKNSCLGVLCAALSSDGTLIALYTTKREILLYEAPGTGRHTSRQIVEKQFAGLGFRGRSLLYGVFNNDKEVALTALGESTDVVLSNAYQKLESCILQFSFDGLHMSAMTVDRSLVIFDTRTGKIAARSKIRCRLYQVHFQFFPFVLLWDGNLVYRENCETGEKVTIDVGGDNYVRSVAISARGDSVAVCWCGTSMIVGAFDVRTGAKPQCVRRYGYNPFSNPSPLFLFDNIHNSCSLILQNLFGYWIVDLIDRKSIISLASILWQVAMPPYVILHIVDWILSDVYKSGEREEDFRHVAKIRIIERTIQRAKLVLSARVVDEERKQGRTV